MNLIIDLILSLKF